MELLKRLDPELPFFHFTSAHGRFYEGDLPDFSVPASRPRQPSRAPQRELLGATQSHIGCLRSWINPNHLS